MRNVTIATTMHAADPAGGRRRDAGRRSDNRRGTHGCCGIAATRNEDTQIGGPGFAKAGTGARD